MNKTGKLTYGKTITWTYKNYFSCDSKDVIYILICKTCSNFYLRQTQDFKQRIAKHKSDVKNPHNTLAGYVQNTLETVTKLNHIFKYFHSIMKKIPRLENIKKNDTFSDGNLH